jgi:hypothetical protein
MTDCSVSSDAPARRDLLSEAALTGVLDEHLLRSTRTASRRFSVLWRTPAAP